MSLGHILVVDDEVINRIILTDNLLDAGYEVSEAEDGNSALTLLEANPERFDAVLLDRMMPGMDGVEVLRHLKVNQAFENTPIILQTALADPKSVAEGLAAGAYYYLTKPFTGEAVLAIVAAALQDRQRHREWQERLTRPTHAIAHLAKGEFAFRTPDQARDIAALVANACPDSNRVVLGLTELMLNAVEHGNLSITYQEKSALIAADRLQHEIAQRLLHPTFAGRTATLSLERLADRIQLTIKDEGQGFAWQNFLEMDPNRAFDTHGRGIAMARMLSLDSVEYRGCGNEVVAAIKLPGA